VGQGGYIHQVHLGGQSPVDCGIYHGGPGARGGQTGPFSRGPLRGRAMRM
jgi:hypothetical protein